jgi:uncharacterized membrane protein
MNNFVRVRLVVGVAFLFFSFILLGVLLLTEGVYGISRWSWITVMGFGVIGFVTIFWHEFNDLPGLLHEVLFEHEDGVKVHPEVLEEFRRSGITIRIAGGPNAPKSPAPRINSYHL